MRVSVKNFRGKESQSSGAEALRVSPFYLQQATRGPQPRQQQQARTAGKGIARLERVKEGEERGLTVAEGREEREGEREAD